MSYSWFRVDSAFVRHPKMLELKAELENPLADAYVVRLWAWTQVYAPSGRFSAALIAGLESELLWTGSRGSLAATLEKTGWLDRVGDEFEVHDWADLQGFHVKKAKKDADRKRKRRTRMSARTDSGRRADGAVLSPRTAPPTDVTDGRNGRTYLLPPAKKPRAPKVPEHFDPRYQPMVGRLLASYLQVVGSPYSFRGSCGKGLKALLKVADDDEIDRRWRIGLLADQYSPKCATVLQLHAKWNELAVVRGSRTLAMESIAPASRSL